MEILRRVEGKHFGDLLAKTARQAMRDCAHVTGVLLEANGNGFRRGAEPAMYGVCDTATKKVSFPDFGTGSRFFNDFSRARACACAQGSVHPGCRWLEFQT
jgi:hypothetical protein